MKRAQAIKEALDRVQGIFALKPEKGRLTKKGHAVLTDGLLCEYTEDGKTIAADMPETFGGSGKPLSPGGHLRAALATCLAIGYAMRAAQRGVAFTRVEVDIEADADFGAMFGLPGCAAGYGEIRYGVHIESEAGEETVRAIVEECDARSPVLTAIASAQKVARTIVVKRAETV
jgi:uncharacterized OsmC-like protein